MGTPRSKKTPFFYGRPPAPSIFANIQIGDWEQLWDSKHSAAYYYNVRTKQSQWERPAAFPDLTHLRSTRLS